MIRFDSIRIALAGIAANRLRSALTMLGMLIGVASVIILVAVGNGSSAAVEASIEKLGTNLLVISPQLTFGATGPAPATSLTQADVQALQDRGTNPAISQVAPVVNASNVTMAFNSTTYSPSSFVGTTPPYVSMHGYTMAGGSFFTNAQVKSHAQVIVVGQTVVSELFGGADPIGDNIHIGSGTFQVIGVLAAKGTNGTQDLDDVARSRLHWGSTKTSIASSPVHFWTYDDLYIQAATSMDIWRDIHAPQKTR